jgi:hypothetical protein
VPPTRDVHEHRVGGQHIQDGCHPPGVPGTGETASPRRSTIAVRVRGSRDLTRVLATRCSSVSPGVPSSACRHRSSPRVSAAIRVETCSTRPRYSVQSRPGRRLHDLLIAATLPRCDRIELLFTSEADFKLAESAPVRWRAIPELGLSRPRRNRLRGRSPRRPPRGPPQPEQHCGNGLWRLTMA